jgi:hypothetical protein
MVQAGRLKFFNPEHRKWTAEQGNQVAAYVEAEAD